ncbi:hypothetical protein Hanom_Chr04g00370071 [Helianthus anomalus]
MKLNVKHNHQLTSIPYWSLTQPPPVAKPDPNDRGSKTYIPKNLYTKTTYITLLNEKFGGSDAPLRLFYTSPLDATPLFGLRRPNQSTQNHDTPVKIPFYTL